MPTDLDADRYRTERVTVRGVDLADWREGAGGVPLVLVHGWPETRRIWWKVVAPLAAAGFDVIAPDLRGFGDSGLAPDCFYDVAAHSRDLHALIDHLGLDRVVLVGGDLGGPVIQDLALRFPRRVERMVLFNSPLPYLRDEMAGMATRPAMASTDYFIRQGTEPDVLAAELPTPEVRRRYIATFYTSRYWAHPGTFTTVEVAFHTDPFGDGAKLRASFGAYESVFNESARSEPAMLARNEKLLTLILYGPSDHVIPPGFDRMAAVVFPNHVGPYLLRDCGHFVPWEAPGPLTSGITALCRDLLASRSGPAA